ncbi:MAG: M56 family metallopeptidase [Sphingobium sp.]
MTGSGFTIWFFEAVIASTLLIALVLLLRPVVARHFGVRAAYALWALPLLRFLLPRLPDGTSPAALLPVQGHAVSITNMREAVQLPAAQFPWIEAALTIWIIGAALFLSAQTLAYFGFRRRMLSDGAVIGRQDGVTMLESVHATGPLAFGIVHRYVVVPVDFGDRYTRDEQAMALAHELEHHRRGDLIANLGALLMLSLHWCNPIAWIAYRAFRADQELACDARVLARHGQDKAQAYGRAILKAATATRLSTGGRFSFCHLNTVGTLKGRLKMLSNHAASLNRISWGMSAVAIVTVAGLALTASGSEAAQEMASVSGRLSEAKLMNLATFMPRQQSEVAPFDVPETPETPMAAVAPLAPAMPAVPDAPVAPMAPEAPRAPYSFPHVPTRAEIAAMTPDVRVEESCHGQPGSTHEYVDAGGKRHVRVALCTSATREQAMADVRAGMAEARAGMAEAQREMAAARIEAAHDRAQARAEAKAAMAEARADMARARADIRREQARVD